MAATIDLSTDLKHYDQRFEPFGPEEQKLYAAYGGWLNARRREIERQIVLGGGRLMPDAGWATRAIRLDDGVFPTRWRLARGERLYDYNRNQFVGQRFKDLVESFDPGAHQFLSLEIYSADGTTRFDEPIYFFKVLAVFDALTSSTGGLKTISGSIDGRHFWSITDPSKLAVDAAKIEGRGVWLELRLLRKAFFASDAFVEPMKGEGLEGWEACDQVAEI